MPDEPAPLLRCEFFKCGAWNSDHGKKPACDARRTVALKDAHALEWHIFGQRIDFSLREITQTPRPALHADALDQQTQQQCRCDEPSQPAKALHHVIHIPSRRWRRRHHNRRGHRRDGDTPVGLKRLAQRCPDGHGLLRREKIAHRDVEGAVEAHQHGQIRQDAAAHGIANDETHQQPGGRADDEAVNDEIEQSDGLRAHDSPPFFVRTSLRSSASSSSVMSPLSTRQRTRARLLPPKKRCFNSASTLVRPRCSGTAGS